MCRDRVSDFLVYKYFAIDGSKVTDFNTFSDIVVLFKVVLVDFLPQAFVLS